MTPQNFTAVEAEGPAGWTTVVARGDVDLATADDLWAVLEPVLGSGRRLVLDTSEVAFMDSAGLRVLLQAGRHAAASGGEFRLVAPTGAVTQVLELAGVTGHLAIHSDMATALRD